MVFFTPVELTFHKPCSAGKLPEDWRRASPVPKMQMETRDGPAISEGVGSTEPAARRQRQAPVGDGELPGTSFVEKQDQGEGTRI